MTKTDATERGRYVLTRALVDLTCSHVFHASIIMRLVRREDVTLPFPMAVDGVHLFVNPQAIADYSVSECAAVLAHEAMHVAGRHPLRMEWRKGMVVGSDGVPVTLWNIACDTIVNHQVGESGMKLPDGCIPPKAGTTPEKEYDLLCKQASKLPKLAVMAGKAGDMRAPTHGDGTPYSAAEVKEQEQLAKQWVEAAAQAAKQAGQLDAGLERFVKRELRSVTPWREVLARFVADKQPSGYNWARPNRRYIGAGMYLPKLEARDVPRICTANDMSGSISPMMAEQVVAEEMAVLELMAGGSGIVELPVLWFDSAVYPQVVTDASELKPHGGGGTDYAPIMKWVAAHMGEFDFKGLVVVTDGYCDSFGKQPPCEVLWVLTDEHNEGFHPPFGEVALVLESERAR